MDHFTIEQGRYTPTDPRLGRHVRHDSRSRAYAFRPRGVVLKSIRHTRRVPIFDQGDLGSCTGNAALGCLASEPFYDTIPSDRAEWDETEAVEIYSRATAIDSAEGQYPPTDTGSDGLSVAKVLQNLGWISGYQHAFSPLAALSALQERPVIVGTDWFEGMDYPDANGVVTPSGSVAGGHEYVMDEYDSAHQLIGFQNSWGAGWGVEGRFYMHVETFTWLLPRDGDVTIFTPNTQPAPVPDPTPVPTPSPTPGDPALLTFAKAMKTWRQSIWPWNGASAAQDAVDAYLRAKGY